MTGITMMTGIVGGASGKEPACQCKRRKRRDFNPWVGKSPWRRMWQPTPVFLKHSYTVENGYIIPLLKNIEHL